MRTFIVKSLLFLVLVLLAILAICIVPKEESKNDYLAGMELKHHRLDSLTGPRIILAAGSNMAFGIDSRQIEHAFQRPVVNLSIIAGLGSSFIIEELRSSIRTGDVILLSLEYNIGEGSDRVKRRASTQYPPAAAYYELDVFEEADLYLEDAKANIRNRLRGLANAKTMNNDPVYCAAAFNKYGDVVSHLDMKSKLNLAGRLPMKYEYWDAIGQINELLVDAERIDAKVFYLFPTFAESQYKSNEEVIDKLKKDIVRDLKTEVLNEPIDFVYPDSLFFDTAYHLNREGTKKRTAKLISIIESNPEARAAFHNQ